MLRFFKYARIGALLKVQGWTWCRVRCYFNASTSLYSMLFSVATTFKSQPS